jgi:hypothetical protein
VGERGRQIKQDRPLEFRDPWVTPTDVALKINFTRAATDSRQVAPSGEGRRRQTTSDRRQERVEHRSTTGQRRRGQDSWINGSMDPQEFQERAGIMGLVGQDNFKQAGARTHGAKTEFGKAGSVRSLIDLQVHPQAVDG